MKNLSLKKRMLRIFVLFVIFITTVVVLRPLPVFAQLTELNNVADKAGLKGETNVSLLIGGIIGKVFGLMGIILLILVITGGIMWMASGGSEEQIKKAKAILKNAFIGLMIIVLAYAISRFVVENLTEVTKSGPPAAQTP